MEMKYFIIKSGYQWIVLLQYYNLLLNYLFFYIYNSYFLNLLFKILYRINIIRFTVSQNLYNICRNFTLCNSICFFTSNSLFACCSRITSDKGTSSTRKFEKLGNFGDTWRICGYVSGNFFPVQTPSKGIRLTREDPGIFQFYILRLAKSFRNFLSNSSPN